MRGSRYLLFRMQLGKMLVDYKIMSRDHHRSIRVEEAVVDPQLHTTVVPMEWLEQLRSPSTRLINGYFTESAVEVKIPGYDGVKALNLPSISDLTLRGASQNAHGSSRAQLMGASAIQAGPVVMYITGQSVPVVLYPLFVSAKEWSLEKGEEIDLRVGLDAIEQCSLYTELRPGGLLYSKLPHKDLKTALEPTHDILKRYGMKCGLAESPLVQRPWTRMKHMFIDELQRGPKLTEFVGYNPRSGTQWRFSQNTRYFRQGIWRETIRRNEMNDGLHAHSSWQKSPQQSVPEVSFLAPYP